jgi:hypothetical protein
MPLVAILYKDLNLGDQFYDKEEPDVEVYYPFEKKAREIALCLTDEHPRHGFRHLASFSEGQRVWVNIPMEVSR